MSAEKRETRAHRSQTVVSEATVYNGDIWGLTLGDLRKLVKAADGIPDDAEATLEDLVPHHSKKDLWRAKRLSVSHRAKAGEQ